MNLKDFLLRILLRNPEALGHILTLAEREGKLPAHAHRLMQGVLKAAERTVEEIMVPRTDMVSVVESMPLREVLEVYARTPYSRFPVLSTRRDEVVGVFFMKDLLRRLSELDTLTVRDLMSPPYFLPEVKPVLDTLTTFQEMHLSIGIVVDEFGSPVGLVTLEDLLEEIVGEIWEEHERPHTPWREVAPGVYEVLATMNLEDFAEVVGLPLEDESVNTIGGYILNRLDHLPAPGEVVDLGMLRVEVLDATPQRLKRLRVHVPKGEANHDQGRSPEAD